MVKRGTGNNKKFPLVLPAANRVANRDIGDFQIGFSSTTLYRFEKRVHYINNYSSWYELFYY